MNLQNMDNVIFLIINLIAIISFITFSCIAINLFQNLLKKPENIKEYSIANIFYTISCCLIYIGFF